jgi:hypothetical protein
MKLPYVISMSDVYPIFVRDMFHLFQKCTRVAVSITEKAKFSSKFFFFGIKYNYKSFKPYLVITYREEVEVKTVPL